MKLYVRSQPRTYYHNVQVATDRDDVERRRRRRVTRRRRGRVTKRPKMFSDRYDNKPTERDWRQSWWGKNPLDALEKSTRWYHTGSPSPNSSWSVSCRAGPYKACYRPHICISNIRGTANVYEGFIKDGSSSSVASISKCYFTSTELLFFRLCSTNDDRPICTTSKLARSPFKT